MLRVGKLVNTHGIKGEVKIISNISTNDVFKIGNTLYIDDTPLVIKTYRMHKNFHMVTFEGIEDINEVLKYKGMDVFINRDDIKGFIIEDLIGYDIYSDTFIGKVNNIIYNIKYPILVLDNKNMIPYIPEFIINVDNKSKKVFIKEIEGLINEN